MSEVFLERKYQRSSGELTLVVDAFTAFDCHILPVICDEIR